MPTPIKVGKELKEIDLLQLFAPIEGGITQRYGRVGQGKTYGATVDVIDELKRGHVVYTNWPIEWNGYDQRQSFLYLVGSLIFPWKNKLTYFPPENLKRIEVNQDFIKNFQKLTNCSVYLDEGHVVFDSYEMAKMSMDKRVAVLHTRHFDRSLHIISQRPTAIHAVLRENVERFYRYEKYGKYPFLFFRRTEFQDLTPEGRPDENAVISVKLYFLKKKIANAYNSKYLRGDTPIHPTQAKVYKVNIFMRIYLLIRLILISTWATLSKKRSL